MKLKFIFVLICLLTFMVSILSANSHEVTIADSWGYPGETQVSVPITTSSLDPSDGVTSVYFRISFPDSIISGVSTNNDSTTLFYNWGPPIINTTDTTIIVAVSDIDPLLCYNGATLINILFDIKNIAAGVSLGDIAEIEFDFCMYSGEEVASLTNGSIEIKSAGAIDGYIHLLGDDGDGDTTQVNLHIYNFDNSIEDDVQPDTTGYFIFNRVLTDTFTIKATLEHFSSTDTSGIIVLVGDTTNIGTLNLSYSEYPTVEIPYTTGNNETVIIIPVTLEEYDDIDDIESFEFKLTFNDSILDSMWIELYEPGTLTNGWSFSSIIDTGYVDTFRVSASIASGNPISSGTNNSFFKIHANVSDSLTGAYTELKWIQFVFDDLGIEPFKEDNRFTVVVEDTIRGVVSYYSDSAIDVKDCLINLSGVPAFGSSIDISYTTNDSGVYDFGLVPETDTIPSYTLEPSYIATGIEPTIVTPFDATLVSRHVVGLDTLHSDTLKAADASGNGVVSSYDAALIMQYSVGTQPSSESVGSVVFNPSDTLFATTPGATDSLHFNAICLGDPSGNWSNYSPTRFEHTITYSGESKIFTAGFRFNGDVYSLYFNGETSDNLEFIGAELAEECVVMNLYENVVENRIKIGSYSTSPIISDNPLIYLTFEKTDNEEATLNIDYCFANERQNTFNYVIEEGPPIDSYSLRLYNNFPNPFSPETNIKFSLPKQENVGLKIYNIKGELVKTLIDENEPLDKGFHETIWRGKNNNDINVGTGVYFYKLECGQKSIMKKMILLH